MNQNVVEPPSDEPADVSRYAVPMGYLDEGVSVQFTGFLGSTGGDVSLYTAAHNLYGDEPVATEGWLGWQRELNVFVNPEPGARSVQVGVIADDGFGSATANFDWSVNQCKPEFMIDALRIREDASPGLMPLLRQRYPIVELDLSPHEFGATDVLTCVGHPRRPENPDEFPYSPPGRCEGSYWRHRDGRIEAAYRSRRGFSGGPVFTQRGRLAGMHVRLRAGIDVRAPSEPVWVAETVTSQDVLCLGKESVP